MLEKEEGKREEEDEENDDDDHGTFSAEVVTDSDSVSVSQSVSQSVMRRGTEEREAKG